MGRYAAAVDGTLAQYIAVAMHGTAWLSDPGDSAPPRLDQTNTTFKYVAGAVFEDGSSRLDVASWLVRLRAAGVTEIALAMPDFSVGPDAGSPPWHVRGAFVGGIPMGLVIATSGGTQLWQARWAAAEPGASKAWQARYQSELAPVHIHRPPLEPTHAALMAALGAAIDFATAVRADSLAQTLHHARGAGFAEHPEPAYHPDMVPERGIAPERRRLLAMASTAHVFGGMGSWNDLAFSDAGVQREYDKVSRQLFTAVMNGFLAAVNSR